MLQIVRHCGFYDIAKALRQRENVALVMVDISPAEKDKGKAGQQPDTSIVYIFTPALLVHSRATSHTLSALGRNFCQQDTVFKDGLEVRFYNLRLC